jgi:hypothetical protein
MLYEFRTYTFALGDLSAYLELAATIGRPARRNDYGVNHGYWTVEVGQVGQVWHLWSYESFAERTRLRGELRKNEVWSREYVPRVLQLVQRQDLRLLNPMVEMKPPSSSGNTFELIIQRTLPGKARGWSEVLAKHRPEGPASAQLVGMWTGEYPQPNEVVQLWYYSNHGDRPLHQDGVGWRLCLNEAAEYVVSMENLLLLPTTFSELA